MIGNFIPLSRVNQKLKLRYSITLSSFSHIEPVEKTLERLQGQGYDAVEMFGEPKKMEMKKLRDILDSFSFPVCGVTGMLGSISEDGWKRRLLSADRSIIKHSEEYVMECIKMCQFVGGREMNVCLFADRNWQPLIGIIGHCQKTEKARLLKKPFQYYTSFP